jgi:hypothetical protein
MMKAEIYWKEDAQTSPDGVVTTPYTQFYWCGKRGQYLHESVDTSTPKEKKRHEEFVKNQETNPWPICKKCQSAKLKSKEVILHE